MRILVIPDVHGSHEWEVAKTFPREEYDFIVFLGDYFDSWENKWPDQGKNFEAICNFIREDSTHRKLLLGNHDWSYLSKTRRGSGVSGHQNGKIDEIRKLLLKNHDIIDLAFKSDGVVFSHAGFSRTWVQSLLKIFGHEEKDFPDSMTFVDFMNEKWHELSFWPGDVHFNYDFEELLDWYGFYSRTGNEVTQGPLWIRPEALLQDAFYRNQVVGHTEYCMGDFLALCRNDQSKNFKNTVIIADSKSHQVFGVIDTEHLPENAMTFLDFANSVC